MNTITAEKQPLIVVGISISDVTALLDVIEYYRLFVQQLFTPIQKTTTREHLASLEHKCKEALSLLATMGVGENELTLLLMMFTGLELLICVNALEVYASLPLAHSRPSLLTRERVRRLQHMLYRQI